VDALSIVIAAIPRHPKLPNKLIFLTFEDQILPRQDFFISFISKINVTAQVALLMKAGGCGVGASPPHHTSRSTWGLSSYKQIQATLSNPD
jgi:hypothetical protein